MTNREAVSKIINPLRLLVKDSHISRRAVLRALRSASKDLITKKLLDRTLQKESKLYTKVECFDLEEIDPKKCSTIEFRRCEILMKSINKIPLPVFSRIGSSILYVESVDGKYQLQVVDMKQYKRNTKRQHQLVDVVYAYIGEDLHLYIPEKEIRSVDLAVLTMHTEGKTGCGEDSECKNAWDAEFICSDKLELAVFEMTLQMLLSTYRQITPDQNPNGIENG